MSTTTKQDKDFASELAGEVRLEPSALQTAIDWIKDNLKPDDVFSDKDLETWAENNGYTKE